MLEAKKQKRLKKVLEQVVNGELIQERLIGGPCEYVGRLMAMLANRLVYCEVSRPAINGLLVRVP